MNLETHIWENAKFVPNEEMKERRKVALGFSVGHDKGAVLIIDGKIIVGISEERLSRLKHDKSFSSDIPIASIDYCLEYANLTYNDVDQYAFNTAEMLNDVEGIIRNQFQFYLRQPLSKLKFVNHHLAHAYSSFFSSGLDESAVVVSDATGNLVSTNNSAYEDFIKNHPDKEAALPEGREWAEATSIYHFTLNGFTEAEKKFIKHPFPAVSWKDCPDWLNLGAIYGYGTMKLVYKYNEDDPNKDWPAAGAGKLMGLASFADKDWVNTQPYLCTYDEEKHTYDNTAGDIYSRYPGVNVDSSFVERANVAGVFQREQERIGLSLALRAKLLTGSKNVCLSGGSFLNCNTNELIVKSGEFDKCYFVPPADDSGIPLGCAWYAYQQISEIKDNHYLSPYLGKSYTRMDVEKDFHTFCKETPGVYHQLTVYDYNKDLDSAANHIARLLKTNKVVGLHQGGSEIGPRALGNRSILASPTETWMQDYVNHSIKNREWYRPFAPSVLHEKSNEVFDLEEFSPYMLITCKARDNWKDKIPAVVHTDGSSRIQSVHKDMNPFYHNIISNFNDLTGIPVVLNTSFNGNYEPVVETPYDAIASFWKNGLDAVMVGHLLIVKNSYIQA
jgi:carbamoyltransferase